LVPFGDHDEEYSEHRCAASVTHVRVCTTGTGAGSGPQHVTQGVLHRVHLGAFVRVNHGGTSQTIVALAALFCTLVCACCDLVTAGTRVSGSPQ
jgi:hypothetical protein